MPSTHGYPILDPTETLTVATTEGYSVATTRSSAVIHCMQWNNSSERWDIEEHFMEQTAEMSNLDL